MFIIKFLGSTAGRWTRGIAGVALIIWGAAIGSSAWALILLGVIVGAAGVMDVCLLAPLFGKPFNGKKLRDATK